MGKSAGLEGANFLSFKVQFAGNLPQKNWKLTPALSYSCSDSDTKKKLCRGGPTKIAWRVYRKFDKKLGREFFWGVTATAWRTLVRAPATISAADIQQLLDVTCQSHFLLLPVWSQARKEALEVWLNSHQKSSRSPVRVFWCEFLVSSHQNDCGVR